VNGCSFATAVGTTAFESTYGYDFLVSTPDIVRQLQYNKYGNDNDY
jgi:hypothetical protein